MKDLLTLLKSKTIYDLGQPLEQGMGQSPNHPQFRMALTRRHGDMERPDGSSAASEVIITGGHVGTHIDALCHVSHKGLLHGSIKVAEAQKGGRFSSHGVETISPIACRGILLDVAASKNTNILPGGYAITADDLKATVESQQIDISKGDAVLVRTGWAQNWSNPAAFIGHETGVPGPDETAARWLCDQGVKLTGSDTIAYEVITPGAGHRLLPVHRLLLVEQGIHICETLQLEELAQSKSYEFIFIALPLKITGATGSPIRPVAVA